VLIDWFTVAAQALNFLILVWLLKRFLYKPILDAIDAREARIVKSLADADAKEAEAKKERDDFQHKNEAFDKHHAALLAKATAEAGDERKRLIDEAGKAAEALSVKREKALATDARNLNQALSRLTQHEVFAIARKALSDLATTSLEERMGEVFIRRLGEMKGKDKTAFAKALKDATGPALVRSAFALPAEQRAAIQNAINEAFSGDIQLRFSTAPGLVSGIELSTNGEQVGWSIAEYLTSLQKGVGALLNEQDKAAAKPKSKPKPKSKSKPKSKPKSHATRKSASNRKARTKAGMTPTGDSETEAKPESPTPAAQST
jgi:F-type H+-transporting ATPase subunit b